MDNQEKINQVVRDSEQLLANLAELKEKSGSYTTAKDELEKTNEKLLVLIETTQSLSEESHKVIQVINDIGSGKIFEKLETLDNKLNKLSKLLKISLSIIGIMLLLQLSGTGLILKFFVAK